MPVLSGTTLKGNEFFRHSGFISTGDLEKEFHPANE